GGRREVPLPDPVDGREREPAATERRDGHPREAPCAGRLRTGDDHLHVREPLGARHESARNLVRGEMTVRIAAAVLLAAALLPAAGAQAQNDDAAKAALQKLADRFKELRTLSAKVVQVRRTELTDKPITSSG